MAPRERDREAYEWRHPEEIPFAKKGEFQAVATRYNGTNGSFATRFHPVASGVVAS